MSKGAKGKLKNVLGHMLTARSRKAIQSIFGMALDPLKMNRGFIQTEERFWAAIKIVTDFRPIPGDDFLKEVYRLRGFLLRMSPEQRSTMIAVVDRAAFEGLPGRREGRQPRLPRENSNKRLPKCALPTGKRPSINAKTEFYASWEWRTLRMEVLKEQGRSCQCCGAEPGMKTAAGDPVRICVDHIKPLSKFWHLRLDKKNLQVLCDECNQGKGNWDHTDFRPASGPDEWVIEDRDIDPAILEQLSVCGETIQ